MKHLKDISSYVKENSQTSQNRQQELKDYWDKYQVDITAKGGVENLLRKYSMELNGNSDYRDLKGASVHALTESLKMIGDGEISPSNGKMKYTEYSKDNNMILVVYGDVRKSPYDMSKYGTKGFNYEVSLYRNNITSRQIGGGYGTSGIISERAPLLFSWNPMGGEILNDERLIVKLCDHIKNHFGFK